MHLVVELLSETAIKHKKPFPSLDWLGHASESIFLLDGGRSCILQLPSGGTKRHSLRHRALYERLRSAVSTCVAPGGAFLAGVSADGELFAWHRDSNRLRCVQPPADFSRFMTRSTSGDEPGSGAQSSQAGGGRLLTPRVFVDARCERALLVRPAGGPLLVWEDGQPSRWSLLTPPDHLPLPDAHCKEAAIDVAFSTQSGERWARCSLVSGSERGLRLTTVTLRWRSPAQLLTTGQSRFSAAWGGVTVPWPQIHPRAALVRHGGALVARYSCGGRLLAVAVNQRDSDVTRLVYVTGEGRAALVADLQGAGATGVHRRHQRQYWVAGLSWLAGDALLAAVTKQGSLALLSALGEPVQMLVPGGRPQTYLLLHALVGGTDSTEPDPAAAAGGGGSPLSSARSACRPLRQRFSVAAHPRRPALLCSSGYLVTLAEVKCHAPLIICDRFISSARDLLATFEQGEHIGKERKLHPPPPSTPALKRPSSSPARTASAGRRRAKRVSFSDHPPSESPGEPPPDSSASWRRVQTVCRRLMAAQGLAASRPGRCTQEWAGRTATVSRLARQLTAAVLGERRLGTPPARLRRLLDLLGRLVALAGLSEAGGRAALAGAGVLAALVRGGVRLCRGLPAQEAVAALWGLCDALQAAERCLQRADRGGQCVDQLERRQALTLFAVSLPPGNPCSPGPPATLGPLWQRLLVAAGSLYSRQRGRLTADQHGRLAALLGRLQRRAQQQGRPLTAPRLPRRTPVLRRYLAGDWAGTETRLLSQLESAVSGGKPRQAARPALGLLYLHVSAGRLRRALETADSVLLRCGSDLKTSLRHPAGRRLLLSLTRLMARYHLAAPLTVQPPHHARTEPPLTATADLNQSVVPREVLTADISTNYLADVWNPQQAFKMLVCLGLLEEAAWFAQQLGDWRTALLVCVLNAQLPPASRRSPPPPPLCAARLLSGQSASYLPLPAASLDVPSLRHLLLAALLSGVPLLPSLLSDLTRHLRLPLLCLPCLVPPEQPLPAVPLYLPVAGRTEAERDGGEEAAARHGLAEAVQKVLAVLRAAGLLERCTLRYLTELRQACRRRQCEQAFGSPSLDSSLEGSLRQLSAQLPDAGFSSEQRQQLAETAVQLRHLCLLLYLLHCRDQLAAALRCAQSDPASASATADSALQIISLTASLQPLSPLPGWPADLASLALDAALTVDPSDRALLGRLIGPLAETLGELDRLSDGNQQRLRRLLERWGDPAAADGCQPERQQCPAGQQLLDGCRLQQLQPRGQLRLVVADGDGLFEGAADVSPLETQPAYLSFLRTLLDVAAPPGPAVTPARPLLAGWRRWHERSQLASPAFLAGYRKMMAAVDSAAAREEHTLGEPPAKVSSELGAAIPASAKGAEFALPPGRPSSKPTPARRGLFRCVSFSDIWRPTGDDEEFLLASGGERAHSRRRRNRRRSRSADAAVFRGRQASSGRSWQTLPRHQAQKEPAQDGGGGGDAVALKHPVFRLAKGISVPRLLKYERIEKLMGWFLLWRHREIRMDLVKPPSGPRIALRPTMPDVLVYIWMTDHMPVGRGQGRGRSAPGRGFGGAVQMEPDMAKNGMNVDTSSSDDAMGNGEEQGEDPMMRAHRGELVHRGRGGGYAARVGFRDEGGGYGARDSRQYERPRSGVQGYDNRGGQRGYQGGGNRYQAYGSSQPYPRRMGNRGYDNRSYQRQDRRQGPGNQVYSDQAEDQWYGDPEFDQRGYEDPRTGGMNDRRPRYAGSPYRPHDRRTAQGYGGSAPPAPGRRADTQQVRFGGPPGRPEKWGSWDDFRAAPTGVRPGRSPPRSFGPPPPDGRANDMHTLVSPPNEPPAGWERPERRRQPAPRPLALPAGTAPGWDKPLHAVRVGAAGAQWKQVHGLDKVEGDECFMVYDDKIVRMENFTADTGATIDVVEKVAVYSPTGSPRVRSARSGRSVAAQPSPVRSASLTPGREEVPCVDCEWQPWSASNLSAQRQPQPAPVQRSTLAVPTPQVPGPGGKPGCVDCGEWQHWSASMLQSAGAPEPQRAASPRSAVSEPQTVSAGAAPSRSDMSVSRQSELSERSDLISQLSDEVRQLRQEQEQLKRQLAARSAAPQDAVNIPQLTQVIDQINDALEIGLARLQRGEPWYPHPIHAPISLQPYIQAMRLPAPLLNVIVYDPESRRSSRSGSRSASRPSSGLSDRAPAAEVDAGYRRMNAEQISQLVAEEVRKALREAAPGSGSADSRQSRRRPRSTSPAPARDIIVHQPVRRSHSHDPNTATPPSVKTDGSDPGATRQKSRSPSPARSAPPGAYQGYPFLLHLEDGGAAEQMAARQVRAIQESPTARKIVQLLRDTDPVSPSGEPDLVERVLGVHRRSLEGMHDRKADNMRVIQLLHDLSEDEEKADERTTQEIRRLDDEIAVLKRSLRALDSTEKLSVWRSPSDELRYLKERLRQLGGGSPPREDKAPSEEVVVATEKDEPQREAPERGESEFVTEGTGSECKVKQPLRPDGRKHTQIVYDTGGRKSPDASSDRSSGSRRSPSPRRQGRKERIWGAGGHMDVDLSEEEPSAPQRARRRYKPEASRSTPDAVVAKVRPAAPLASRSVFETTRAYQTSGEDRYIRAADLEPMKSGPLGATSTTEELELGSYAVSESDQRNMARPVTTRDALGLAEGHDFEQQISRDRIARARLQQTGRRAPSPPPAPPPATPAPAALTPAAPTPAAPTPAVLTPVSIVDTTPVREPTQPPVPSSTVPSDPLLRTVPSWGRQTDSATGVTSSVLKSFPSYLPTAAEQRPVSEEEHTLQVGPLQVGISPNRLLGQLTEIGTKIGQAVGLVEQQQQSFDEVRQVLEELGAAPGEGSTDSLQPFSSALAEPTESMQRLLDQRLQASSLDVMFSAQDCDDSEIVAPANTGAGGVAETSPDPPDVAAAPDVAAPDPDPPPGDGSPPQPVDETDQ